MRCLRQTSFVLRSVFILLTVRFTSCISPFKPTHPLEIRTAANHGLVQFVQEPEQFFNRGKVHISLHSMSNLLWRQTGVSVSEKVFIAFRRLFHLMNGFMTLHINVGVSLCISMCA